ncbi:MAG TPA: thiamine pyrophosphate-dependent enzyme [Dermatophilaceae bacterium]|nr:thiamine pyrophosphate-dependent enzyme [Dermatophilaceae bacterium]
MILTPTSTTEAAPLTRTTAQAMVDGLLAHGVDTVFGLPGVQTYPLFEALAEVGDRIRVVGARHEQACGYMAFGYAQATGRLGVCCVVPGPGVLNASTALLTAQWTSTPVLCLTSEIPSTYLGRGLGHLHEMDDQQATLRSFTSWAGLALAPSQAPAMLDEAIAHACGGRPGVATLAAPWDVLPVSGPVPPPNPRTVAPPPLDEGLLARAAELLAGASRPMILVGGGARDTGSTVRSLAQLLGAPVVSFRGGRGIVSDADPLGFTCGEGFELWPDTDVMLALGSRQELAWFRWPDRPADLTTIAVDIDPHQHVRTQPTLAITADATQAATRLLDLLRQPGRGGPDEVTRQARMTRMAEAKDRIRPGIVALQPHVDYLRAIRDVLPDEGFLVEEITQVGFVSYLAFPVTRPRQFITAGCQGTLGFGFPTALGVKAAFPEAPVVSLAGDGGFLFGAMELATAVQYGLGVVVVLFDNAAYGNVKADQQRIYGRPFGSDLVNPDFVAMARSFGADGYESSGPEELRTTLATALTRAQERRRPAVLHVTMPLDPSVTPWPFLMPASRRG